MHPAHGDVYRRESEAGNGMKAGSRTRPKLPPVAEGVYPFVCVGVIDMGEQESIWKGKSRYSDKVKLIFELPGETIEVDGEDLPRQLSRNFTFSSSSKSALRQFVSSWLGRSFTDGEFSEFELFELLGKPGLLSVVHSEDGQYANVGGAMALARGMAAPSAKSAYLRFDTTEWEEELFAALPEYLQEQLKKSTQYKNRHLPSEEVSVAAAAIQAAEDADDGEECPF